MDGGAIKKKYIDVFLKSLNQQDSVQYHLEHEPSKVDRVESGIFKKNKYINQ